MSKQGKNCQVPTPLKYVENMLEYIGYDNNVYGKRVLENSCGEGNILAEIVKRFIADGKRQGYSSTDIANELANNVVGYEIDQSKIQICKRRLNKILREENIPRVKWNIRKKDFLKAKETADYIIGNPPYITYHDLTEKERSYLQANFTVCKHGRFDYCYAFIEASIKALNTDGCLVYLIPYSIFRNKFAAGLRSFLTEYITDIWDYRGEDVFQDITCSAAVIACKKSSVAPLVKYKCINDAAENEIMREELKKLNGEKWIFQRTTTGGKRFGDYFDISNSVATLLNKAFLIDVTGETDGLLHVGNKFIEKEITFPAISTKSVCKKKTKGVIEERIIFPYQVNKGKVSSFDETELKKSYPYAYQYLQSFKEELDNRKADKRALWYEFGRSQALERLWDYKLIIPMVITKKVKAHRADITEIPYAGYFIKVKDGSMLTLDDAKKIIESKEFYQYVQDVGTPTTKTSYRISVFDLADYKF